MTPVWVFLIATALVAFVGGGWFFSRPWKRLVVRYSTLLNESIQRETATLRMLSQASQPKITILPAPKPPEPKGFDWKAGTGVE